MGQSSLGRRAAVASILICVATAAHAQFNIDLDLHSAPPELGGGAPSSSFGAASGQSGFWNAVPATGEGPVVLRDLEGNLSGITFSGVEGGGGNAFNNPANTGDFARMLNDGRFFDSEAWTFSGLAAGDYILYAYAVHPSGMITNTTVTVVGSTVPVQTVAGPMPGNAFQLGITHSRHEIFVSDGTLTVQIDRGIEKAYVNGFQLVAVPEPGLLVCLSAGIAGLLARRRNSKRR